MNRDIPLTTPGTRPLPRPHRNILIVGDENQYRGVMEALLKEEGYTVSTCRSSGEVLRLIRNQSIGFVILEQSSGELGVLQFLGEIKEIEWGMPVLVILYQYDLELYLAAKKLGALDVLAIPIDFEELRRNLNSHQATFPYAKHKYNIVLDDY
ncbi:MAG: response regulator [Terriglobia bacterium]